MFCHCLPAHSQQWVELLARWWPAGIIIISRHLFVIRRAKIKLVYACSTVSICLYSLVYFKIEIFVIEDKKKKARALSLFFFSPNERAWARKNLVLLNVAIFRFCFLSWSGSIFYCVISFRCRLLMRYFFQRLLTIENIINSLLVNGAMKNVWRRVC